MLEGWSWVCRLAGGVGQYRGVDGNGLEQEGNDKQENICELLAGPGMIATP